MNQVSTSIRHTIYITSFLCLLLFGSVKVGPFSLSNYATLFLFFLIILNANKCKKLFDVNIRLYIAFTLVFLITLLLNQEIALFDNVTYFFARIFPSIVIYVSVSYYIRSEKELRVICFVLLGLIVINCWISVLQFNANPIGILVSNFINPDLSYEDVNYSRDVLLGYIPVAGIFSGVVNNALMTSSLFAVPVFLNKTTFSSKLSIFLFFLPSIISSYIMQERIAFILILLALLLSIFKLFGIKRVFLFIPLIIFGVIYSIQNIDLGRFSNMEDDRRIKMYMSSIDWIMKNIFLGGPVSFGDFLNKTEGYTEPHNFFLSAFVYGGFICAGILMIIFFKILFISIKNLILSIKSSNSKGNFVFVFSIGMINALLNGLTHNNSIVYGYSSIWFFYALLIRSIQLNSEKRFSKKNEYKQ